jgi:3-deoxy-D-manno-octulosonate 8-phosphate phosphatase (KDO 8-P phosphatase)
MPTDPDAAALAAVSAPVRARLMNVRLLALDVDGVLTDGGVYFDDAGGEMKRFHIHDGLGIVLARFVGLQVAWITGRNSPVVQRRAKELGVTLLRQGVRDKVAALAEVGVKCGVTPDAIAYMGDDLNDLPALRWAGVALAPANAASPEVREAAHLITARAGGAGAARDAIELILRARGDWDAALGAYLISLSTPSAKNPTQ